MRRVRMMLLVGVASTWPAFASALEFPSQGDSGSQLTTSPSGFVGVMGPNGFSPPDHAQTYLPPSPPPAAACPSCAPSGQSQPPTGQPAQH